MSAVKQKMKRSVSVLLSALICSSVMSVWASLPVSAVSYSEMSALDQYAYSGNDLGADYSKASTTFKVWAPTASSVQLKRYKTGSDSEAGAGVIETKDMTKQSQGVWSVTVSGDLANTYYTYLVTNNGSVKETVDIYAKSTGVNGKRGMVVDFDSTDPVGWENDKRVSCPNQTDAVIWEAHVRDFSASSDSGMTNKGKYLAFTETGTTVNGDGIHPTGVDYLEDLGVTHVHLLPVYDYGSVDETKLSTDQFNWGYDPMNYNTPEGSYSTDPYHGEVRVKEFKQMVQSLHNKGIGVVMDVVYNHTYAGGSGVNDWFDYTVPGYYYRQNSNGKYSDASGCGNETASDRAMYQKFMIDSLKYWCEEYHLDGFRFDLMGIHDCDTMNKIRQELDKISPDILIYGEPWTAAATPCPKATAVQGNMKLVSEEVAAFNDKVRDAIKGSCFNASDPGFIQGAANFETALKGGIQASSTTMAGTGQWSKQPSQTVTYTSAHDNYTLYDKLVKSCKGGSGYGNRYDDLVAMNKLAGGIILTSQGMSFFQAGEEFARSKYGDENSYKSATSVNQLVWNNTITYADIVKYYKGLIAIRKAYAPFRDPTNISNNTIYFSWGDSCPANVVAFTMYNKQSTGKEWNFAAVIHNANASQKTVKLMTYDGVTLPTQWVMVADGTNAGTESLGTISGNTVTVPARSTVVLIDKASFDSTDLSSKCTVTVNHILESSGQTLKTETLKGDEGTSYSTSADSSLISQGYIVDHTSGNTSGTFSETGAVVNYYYKIDTSTIGSVLVRYIDSNTGTKVAADETITGKIGTPINISPKTISGYDFDRMKSSDDSTVFSDTIPIVTMYYTQKASTGAVVHYYNSSGWSQVYMYTYTGSGSTATQYSGAWPGSAMTSEGDNWYYGEVNDIETLKFIANNKGAGSQDPSGDNAPGYDVSGEVWIKNKKVYPTGIVKVYIMLDGGTKKLMKTLKGMADGTNSYSVDTSDFPVGVNYIAPDNTSGLYTAGTTEVVYTTKPIRIPWDNTSTLSSDSITEGQSVTINGSVSNPEIQAVYTYQYSKEGQTSKTTIGQENTTASSMTFTPPEAGNYTIYVTADDNDLTVLTAELSLEVKKETVDTLTNNSTISSTSVTAGTAVTMNGKATGGTSPYKYAYYYKKSTDSSWTKAYVTSSGSVYTKYDTMTFTPETVGTYNVKINVKDRYGEGDIVSKDFTLTVQGGALKNNSTISSTAVTAGTAVTMTGKATGGTSPYKYAYYYKKSTDSAWTKAYVTSSGSAYTKYDTMTFTPSSAGKYNVRINVKDKYGEGDVVSKDFTLTVQGGALKNNSTISSTTATTGTAVTMTGMATGGTSPYKYAYYYKKSTDSAWTKAYVTSSGSVYTKYDTMTFTPTSAGTYNVRINVKDRYGEGDVVSKDFTLTVKSGALANNSRISTSTVSKGTTVTLTGKASGGTEPYKFAYYYKKSTASDWTKAYITASGSAYTKNTIVTFTPETSGTYNVKINVKDNNGTGTAVAKSFTLTVK